MISTTNVPFDQKTPQFTIDIDNKGVGPAMIDTFDIAYQNHHFSDEQDYVKYFVKEKRFKKDTVSYFQRSALWKGRVVSAGEQIHWLLVRGPLARVAEPVFSNTTVTVRFKSIYGEMWEYRGGSEQKVEKVEN